MRSPASSRTSRCRASTSWRRAARSTSTPKGTLTRVSSHRDQYRRVNRPHRLSLQPATAGLQARFGDRQSMPSISIDSCCDVSVTVPPVPLQDQTRQGAVGPARSPYAESAAASRAARSARLQVRLAQQVGRQQFPVPGVSFAVIGAQIPCSDQQC